MASQPMKGARTLKWRDLDSIKPYEKNPRTHSDAQVQAIASSIKRFGFTNPILLDGDNGIIAGHGRLMAATLLKMKQVPCIDLHGLSKDEQRAYIIADNQLALQAGWDYELLALEVEELAQSGMDISLLGFSEKEMALIERMGAGTSDEKQNTNIGGDRFLLMIEFENEQNQQALFAELQERGMNVKVLT